MGLIDFNDPRLRVLYQAIAEAVPKAGHPFVAFLRIPDHEATYCLSNLDTGAPGVLDTQRIANLVIGWLLEQDPATVLRTFELERNMKIRQLTGDTTTDPGDDT
jgi:hypothetical protein